MVLVVDGATVVSGDGSVGTSVVGGAALVCGNGGVGIGGVSCGTALKVYNNAGRKSGRKLSRLVLALVAVIGVGSVTILIVIILYLKRKNGSREKAKYNANVELFLRNHEFLAPKRTSHVNILFREKESKISMSHMRGTPGYIAPELFSRNFGEVSHKSDVYSYGMMILEMVGGRKNIDVGVGHTSEIYFPHWIYKKIELHEEQLGLHGIASDEENRIARKMIIVGLWCIQTNPLSRPRIAKVLEMLEGDLGSLEIPPKPYISSPSRSPGSPSTNSLHRYCSSTDSL
ncbi:hypothetical protein L1987_06496 [Smallanthus sonchifolius]|uniref:Uncharacterized protein n=1 Tax=Smallanthus sonchifolius TaxID=185202 RepID=A0ACB9JYA6_9ASTR|nr:hypothetical protein L1987_06496 [Smallanthus sonchifolius]